MTYPNDADGDALRRIAADGSDMSQPMEIDFFVAVPDEAAGQAVAAKAASAGYEPELSFDTESREWTCYCSREMIPTHEAVVAAQAELDQLSLEFGGVTDGWGTYGNADVD